MVLGPRSYVAFYDNGMLNVANANCDLFVRLVDWMAFGLSG